MGNQSTRHGALRINQSTEINKPFPSGLPQLFGPDKEGFYYHEKDQPKTAEQTQSGLVRFKYNAADYDPHQSHQAKKLLKYKSNRYEWIYVVGDNHSKCYNIQQSSYFDPKLQEQRTMSNEHEKIRNYLLHNDPIPPYFLHRSKLADVAYRSMEYSSLWKLNLLKCVVATRCIDKDSHKKMAQAALLIWDGLKSFLKYNDQVVYMIHLVSFDEKTELQCKPVNKYELNRDRWNLDGNKQYLQVNYGLSDIAHWCLKYDMDNNYEYTNCSHFMMHLFQAFQIVNPWYTLKIQNPPIVKTEETLASVLKSNNLYDNLYQVLNEASIDLETLKYDVKTEEIQELGVAVGMNGRQLQQFTKFMMTIRPFPDDEKSVCHSSKTRHYFDMTMVVTVIGDSGVGKTSLLNRYASDSYNCMEPSTIGAEFQYCNEPLSDDTIMRIKIWDTAGQERFRSVTRSYYRVADAILVCFDVSQENTFENCSSWINDIHNYGKENVSIILVGCKGDALECDRQSAEDQAQMILDRFGTLYCECSAKTGDNVRNVFQTAAELVLQTRAETNYKEDIDTMSEILEAVPHNVKPRKKDCDVYCIIV